MKQMGRRRLPAKKASEEAKPELEDAKPQEVNPTHRRGIGA